MGLLGFADRYGIAKKSIRYTFCVFFSFFLLFSFPYLSGEEDSASIQSFTHSNANQSTAS